jgi:hypothetical protein
MEVPLDDKGILHTYIINGGEKGRKKGPEQNGYNERRS